MPRLFLLTLLLLAGPMSQGAAAQMAPAAVAAAAKSVSAPAKSLAAPESACAALPETGLVAAPAPPDTRPARPAPDRSLRCPPDWTLDMTGRLPMCTRPGLAQRPGNPRAACRAGLALGPIAAITPRWRPTRSCPQPAITSDIQLIGPNAGLGDAVLRAVPGRGVTLQTLVAGSGGADDPAARGCFAPDCRLVRVTIAAEAADDVQLQLGWPGLDPVMTPLPVLTVCPDPAAPR